MGITMILALLSGVALFLFGMSLMGDGLKKAAGEKLELILYRLTSTPLKGVLLGAVVTAIIQSSSATTVMVVGFVNSGMMKVAQAIGIIMGANIGTSITGWILSLSYIDGSSGVAQLLSTATISAVVSIVGILFKMVSKKSTYKNVGDIMLGFSILMMGMQTMSGAVSPLKENEHFVNMLTMFSNPFMGILVGILFTAVLQSASASVGILQALSATGAVSFATAFPITMGIGVGAAFIKWIEKLVFCLVKDTEEDREEQADFDLLEERFIAYPAIAIGQSHTAINGMAKKARKNILRAMGLLDNYAEERYQKVQEKENLIDKYEDKLGTYLMQLRGRDMNVTQTKQVSIFLHTISDFERLGDHAVNISKAANELHEKKINFSDEANYELGVLGAAVKEVLDLTVKAFCEDDLETAAKVEPLRELITILCNELKTRHITRLRVGKCEMKQGFAFNNLLTDYERIGAHCSNIAVAMIETESSDFDTHKYLKSIRELNNEEYTKLYEEYEQRFDINGYKKAKKK